MLFISLTTLQHKYLVGVTSLLQNSQSEFRGRVVIHLNLRLIWKGISKQSEWLIFRGSCRFPTTQIHYLAQYDPRWLFEAYHTIHLTTVRYRWPSLCSLCNPKDCSWPGSSVHGIFQARILEWPFPSLAIPFSKWSSQPRDRTLHCRHILYQLSH